MALGSLEADRRTVEGLYQRFLRRTADASAATLLSSALQMGAAEWQVMGILLGSDEYFQVSLSMPVTPAR